MKRHIRDNYFVVGEGILTNDENYQPVCHRPSTEAELRKFRFSRMGPKGQPVDEPVRKALAEAMTAAGRQPDSSAPTIPAGFTYLGQFIDHDLTLDKTARSLGEIMSPSPISFKAGRLPSISTASMAADRTIPKMLRSTGTPSASRWALPRPCRSRTPVPTLISTASIFREQASAPKNLNAGSR